MAKMAQFKKERLGIVEKSRGFYLPAHCVFTAKEPDGTFRMRFDWRSTYRSKYKPHQGHQEMARRSMK